MVPPTVGWALQFQSTVRQSSTDMFTGLSDQGNPSFSQWLSVVSRCQLQLTRTETKETILSPPWRSMSLLGLLTGVLVRNYLWPHKAAYISIHIRQLASLKPHPSVSDDSWELETWSSLHSLQATSLKSLHLQAISNIVEGRVCGSCESFQASWVSWAS